MIAGSGLSVSYGSFVALDRVSVTLMAGSFTTILGANGAGKSTLLRLLAGIARPDQGKVWIDGDRSLTSIDATERGRRIAWLPHDMNVPFRFTAAEIVLLGRYPWHQGYPTSSDRREAAAALAAIGAEHLADRAVQTLSSGERQRVFLARALALKAEVLLLDEPTTNLDIAAALDLLDLLRRLAAAGVAVCSTLHDLTLARRYGTDAVLLRKGAVVAAGPVAGAMSEEHLEQTFAVRTRSVEGREGQILYQFDRRGVQL